jgi:hypothetical protein
LQPAIDREEKNSLCKNRVARRRGAAFIWKWGAICGIVLGVIQIIISLLHLGSLKTILDVLVWLIGFFVIGLFAARQTGKAGTGALLGLVAGLIGSLIAVIFVIVQIATNGQQITQALNQAGISPGKLNTADVVGIVIALIVTVDLELGLGAGIGALGGLVGRRLASPATSTPVVNTLWTPPSHPLPRSPARHRVRAFLLNVAGVLLGILVGVVLTFLTAGLLVKAEANAMQTTTNGWSITMQ